ncbi:MAG: UDP-N-acetylmuramoyl-tripeptide--D-alanyl-D-alanine ligase, partial [Gemmatimonadota bacterium]|nr:UDP-N-acetylmuramoyl-tripeptide--D-alanyl-D-alanine ligase [Gemmatimonadota bacterium]
SSKTLTSSIELPRATSFWTLARAATALRARTAVNLPTGSVPLRGVSTDTRAIQRGDLFVALRGERFDAHDFLADAVARGAGALVVSAPDRAAGLGVPVFGVDDTLRALGDLARHRRRAWGKPVVAIAGSNGKTTTKELTRAALGSILDVHATTGNLNNLVGVPLTLLALPDEADIAIVELGTNVPGEIARLRDLAGPQLAVVTSIGEEHLEGLGSLDQILTEETSVYDGVDIAVAPGAHPEAVARARATARRTVVAGLEGGDISTTAWGVREDGLGWLEVAGVTVRPPLRGAHNVRNAVLALAVARECGVSIADAARGIAEMAVPAMRMAWETLGRATLINDAYNANPPSMRAALDLLATLDRGRQRVAVLGTMREMGAHAPRLHAELARYALAAAVDVIAGVGEMADALRAEGVDDARVVTAADVDELWTLLEARLASDAVILLKASRGVRLERIVPRLEQWAGARSAASGSATNH